MIKYRWRDAKGFKAKCEWIWLWFHGLTELAVVLALCNVALADECWELSMTLNVPRVYDNAQSEGYRKYQTQKLSGCFTVSANDVGEPTLSFCSLENKTHKVGGEKVRYSAEAEDVKWHVIGSNKTGKFDVRSVSISLVAEPDYAKGEVPTEDNSLVVVLSGKGKSKSLSGNVAGQLGCGCAEYGHTSPTRICGNCEVVDTAAVYGTWKAKRVR